MKLVALKKRTFGEWYLNHFHPDLVGVQIASDGITWIS
jgi:hypothetical protein